MSQGDDRKIYRYLMLNVGISSTVYIMLLICTKVGSGTIGKLIITILDLPGFIIVLPLAWVGVDIFSTELYLALLINLIGYMSIIGAIQVCLWRRQRKR